MPPPKKQPVADPYANMPEPPEPQDPYANMPDAFAAPKDNKEGLYRMQTPDRKLIQVPYSKVMDAYKSGWKIHPDDRNKYGDDKTAEFKKKGMKLNPDIDIPMAFDMVSASPKFGSLDWVKSKAKEIHQAESDLLPTAGGVIGGVLAGGAGIESGPGAIATGAAGAAAGGGLGEIARQVIEEHEHPYDHHMTGKEAAEHIAAQAGVQGASELTGRLGSKLIAPAVSHFGETAIASEKTGVKLLPTEAAGKAPSFFEKLAKGHIFSSGKMQAFRDEQNAQTKEAVNKLADSISNFKGDSSELGKLVQDGIEHHRQQFRVLQNQLYKDIEGQVNERTIKVPVTTTKQVPTGLVDQYGKPTFTTVHNTTLQDQIVDDVMPSTIELKKFAAQELKKLDQVEKILDPNLLGQSRSMLQNILDAPKNLTFSAMRAARSDTLAKVRELDQALAGKQAGLAKKMASLFDDSIMDAVQKSKIPGLEDAVRAADKFTADEHMMFEQDLVKKLVETKKPEAIATLLRGRPTGGSAVGTGIDETMDIMNIIPNNFHAPIQRQLLLDTMRQSTNRVSKVFNERKFAESIGNIGDERGVLIFGKNWSNIKELTSIMERINGPTGLGGGTGAALQNIGAIRGIVGASYLAPLALVSGGHIEGAAGSAVGQLAFMRGLANALTHPEATAKLLTAIQVALRGTPYAITGAVAVERGQRRAKGEIQPSIIDEVKTNSLFSIPLAAGALTLAQVKDKVQALHDQFYKSGLSPKPPDATPAPQPAAQPAYTHTYDPDTGQIVAVQ